MPPIIVYARPTKMTPLFLNAAILVGSVIVLFMLGLVIGQGLKPSMLQVAVEDITPTATITDVTSTLTITPPGHNTYTPTSVPEPTDTVQPTFLPTITPSMTPTVTLTPTITPTGTLAPTKTFTRTPSVTPYNVGLVVDVYPRGNVYIRRGGTASLLFVPYVLTVNGERKRVSGVELYTLSRGDIIDIDSFLYFETDATGRHVFHLRYGNLLAIVEKFVYIENRGTKHAPAKRRVLWSREYGMD